MRQLFVLGHAPAEVIAGAQEILRNGNILIGGFLIPLHSSRKIGLRAQTIEITVSQIILCGRFSGFGGFLEAGKGLFIILCNAGAFHITAPQHISGFLISQLDGLLIERNGVLRICRNAGSAGIAQTQLHHCVRLLLCGGLFQPLYCFGFPGFSQFSVKENAAYCKLRFCRTCFCCAQEQGIGLLEIPRNP